MNPAREQGSNARSLPNKFVKPFGLAALANIIWGSSFLASKWTLIDLGPFTASASRFVLALAFLWAFQRPFRYKISLPKKRETWVSLLWTGLAGFGFLYPLQLAGLRSIPSSLSAAIMLTSPLFLIVLNSRLRKEKAALEKWVAVALGMVGGVIILSNGKLLAGATESNVLIGSLLTFGASLCLALSVVTTKRVTEGAEKLNAATITFFSMLFGLVIMLPLSAHEISQSPVHELPSVTTSLSLIFLSLFCSVIGFVMWNRAISEASLSAIASTMHIKTPMAIMVGIAIGHEVLSPHIFVGTLIVFFAVWLSQRTSAAVSSKSAYLPFAPDLIIEATKVCDQACRGCYAPNVFAKDNLAMNREFFLEPTKLHEQFNSVTQNGKSTLKSVSIRGGEPTLHPRLDEILKVARTFSSDIFLETHGKWIRSQSTRGEVDSERLLMSCKEYDVTIKISFDSMHGLSPGELRELTSSLEELKVKFVIAITEVDLAAFEATRKLCNWVPSQRIIFQRKVKRSDELVKPPMGVVDVSGEIKQLLNSKWTGHLRKQHVVGTT